nr:unnamed protein product [Callosobruchus analis]
MAAQSRATVLSNSKFNANPLTCTRNSQLSCNRTLASQQQRGKSN